MSLSQSRRDKDLIQDGAMVFDPEWVTFSSDFNDYTSSAKHAFKMEFIRMQVNVKQLLQVGSLKRG